jgi:hypothetical protein
VRVHGSVDVEVHLVGDLGRQLRAGCPSPRTCGRARLPRRAILDDLAPFHGDLGSGELGLAGYRGVLPRGHGERTGRHPGQPGEYDRLGALPLRPTDDTGDQGEVGDQPVHGAEHRWA